ncbi:hypothetical protein GJAV_G00208370 [Gymnothorax javanicus]|nr:hypothetical protein GJAV_G00208370 [Gymnothorax javanicus]
MITECQLPAQTRKGTLSSTMKALLHAVSFFLVCVLAYYIAQITQQKEELSLEHRESANSPDTDSPATEPAEELSEALRDVAEVPEQDANQAVAPEANTEQDIDVPIAVEHDLPSEVPETLEEDEHLPNPLARGWGEDIDWVESYEDGLRKAQTSQKPLMIIHHLENCPTCQALKAAFSEDEEIQRMAREEFIMFNLMHETQDPNLAPDGYYVPRIMFVDPSMVIRTDIVANDQLYKHSYTDKDLQKLEENMKQAKIPPS